jgi:hypothetical protein
VAISGKPRPLPECKGECGLPTVRHVWLANDGKCNSCATPEDRMRAEHRRQRRLRAAAGNGTARGRVEQRINELAAKRTGRASGDPLAR